MEVMFIHSMRSGSNSSDYMLVGDLFSNYTVAHTVLECRRPVVDHIQAHAHFATQLPSIDHDLEQFAEQFIRHLGRLIAASRLRQQWRQQFAQSDCKSGRSREIVRVVLSIELTALERAVLGAMVA